MRGAKILLFEKMEKKNKLAKFYLIRFLSISSCISWNVEREKRMRKLRIVSIALLVLMIFSFSSILISAQYVTQKTTNIVISSSGKFSASESEVGVSYTIYGTPGSNGTVTASVYNGNPQPTAVVPNAVGLTYFLALSFNVNPNNFQNATITISYTSSDVQNINAPYSIYKYTLDGNQYVALPSTVDTNSKTITFTIFNTSDPLFAFGGGTNSSSSIPSYTWAIIIVFAVAILLLAIYIVRLIRKPENSENHPGELNEKDLPPETTMQPETTESKIQTSPIEEQKTESPIGEPESSTVTSISNSQPEIQSSESKVENKAEVYREQNINFLPIETPKPELPDLNSEEKSLPAPSEKTEDNAPIKTKEKKSQMPVSKSQKKKKQNPSSNS